LSDLYALGRPVDRERHIGDEVVVRVERLEEVGDFIIGEMCRKQKIGIPPEATDDGLTPVRLADGSGLGHLSVFIYHFPTRCLLYQENRNGVSLPKLSAYMDPNHGEMGRPMSLFNFTPVELADPRAALNANGVRKFIVKFAAPENLGYLEDPDAPYVEQAEAMREEFGGLEVEIAISVGRRKDPRLDKQNVTRTIDGLINHPLVTKMRAVTDGEDDQKMIDFLNRQLMHTSKIELTDDNPNLNYIQRKNFLLEGFRGNLNYVEQRYRRDV
nr:hypothetical protein [Alphaproteobacteria bacterium]